MAAATQAVEAAKKAIQEGGKEKIEAAVAELTKASHQLAEALYKSTAAPGGGDAGGGAAGEPTPGTSGGADDVVDAEVVSDDKK